MNTAPRLIIICGLPGSGKTTLAKQLEQRLSAIRFCPDEWMNVLSIDLWDEDRRGKIESLQWKVAQEVLRVGQTAIIEWGTWGRGERDVLRIGARSLGAAVELHYLTASPEQLFDRTQRRARENPPITLDMLTEWSEMLQAPTPEEMALFDEPCFASNPVGGILD